MSGESDLDVMLAGLDVHMDEEPVVYALVPRVVDEVGIRAVVVEDEGITVVLGREDADEIGLAYEFVGAWLTLTVHSALDSVGLTATFSHALADAQIPCNVLAGTHHDHVVVPWEARHDAVAVIRALSLRSERE
ncbi:ACT domain-containing protein [Aeromicrobium massiliense]|uniref:ACT domain-containing protein n=1 Tax=Aeromicrobium massiliense TaxID=1464554 RepID=UPI0002F5E7D6|nr:ACT domain-containing protein [Aeromicrobium massiliense]